MTIRELFISLGFEVDAQSEKKAEAAIQGLKNTAAAALNAVNTEPLREGMEKASQAYDLYLSGQSVVGIIKELSKCKILSPKGKEN